MKLFEIIEKLKQKENKKIEVLLLNWYSQNNGNNYNYIYLFYLFTYLNVLLYFSHKLEVKINNKTTTDLTFKQWQYSKQLKLSELKTNKIPTKELICH